MLKRDGNALEVSMNNKWSFFTKSNNGHKLDLHLTMPELSEMELTGTSHTILKDFNAEDIAFDISGASSCNAAINTEKLVVDMSGASSFKFVGKHSENVFGAFWSIHTQCLRFWSDGCRSRSVGWQAMHTSKLRITWMQTFQVPVRYYM